MPVQGNHEVFANVYYKQFALPVMPGLPPEYIEHAWGLTYGNIHIVGLNSNTQTVVEEQVAWLDAHLAQVSVDPEIDWIIALMHHPPYSSSSVHGSTTRLQEHWVPIFETHGVDLVFSGHDHAYERSHPIRGTQVMEDGAGVVYVVAGGFGSPGYSNGTSWWTVTSTHGDVGNYVVTEFKGKSVTLTAYDITGKQVLDTFTLTKP
jgi:3',5'-cyclic AMP phosphodiesterase CpdA